MDVMQLKTLQDWVVERRLRMVPGVADVLVLGGKTKEFQAEIDQVCWGLGSARYGARAQKRVYP